MATRTRFPQPAPSGFPECVPTLVDPDRGVALRAHVPTDQTDMVEACRDPEVIRWTTVPAPDGGYGPADADTFLTIVQHGWASGDQLHWAIEAERDGRRRFCGGVHLALDQEHGAEVGYLLHPAARGRSVMSSALRLVRDYAFDVMGLEVVRWRALAGNWESRRVAARAGFVFDGTVRLGLAHRGELMDAWLATMTLDDPRTPPQVWLVVPQLNGRSVRLREFAEADLARVVEACSDSRTRHWLISLPEPYTRDDAAAYLEGAREQAARRTGLVWCIADPDDNRCLGAISLDGLGGYARRAEIGYWAHPDARGRGVVTEAVRLVTEHAEDVALVDSIVIRCAVDNRASRHVAERAGYAHAGLLPACEPLGDGELSDLVSYSRP